MRVLSAVVSNFVSYKDLSFDFTEQGLTLVSGPTGAGKSTLCDVIPWILFGRTAKGGSVDEVRNWSTDEETYGRVAVEMPDLNTLYVTRIRGAKNDLKYTLGPDWENSHRGKDIPDTQKLINELLGFDAETYLAGAYFHEFSTTASFFTTTAKNRRALLEQVTDLSMAVDLSDKLSAYAKELKSELITANNEFKSIASKCSYIQEQQKNALLQKGGWEQNQSSKIERTEKLYASFEADKQKKIKSITDTHGRVSEEMDADLKALAAQVSPLDFEEAKHTLKAKIDSLGVTVCETCGAAKDNTQRLLLTRQLHQIEKQEAADVQARIQMERAHRSLTKHNNSLPMALAAEAQRVNAYGEVLEQLKAEVNPHLAIIKKLKADLKAESALLKDWEQVAETCTLDMLDAELLKDAVAEFRTLLVRNAVKELESSTNKLLNDHFDAEIRVQFDAGDSDKLEVGIMKDANECSYTQLSKGQRQLLRLCFGISVMKVISNHNGTHFSAIFLDEAFDGLSEQLKVKAFDLLQELSLEHESVFCVEHSQELRSLFTHEYRVTLTDEGSQLEEA